MSADRINQANAQDMLERILAAAGSQGLATRHRRNLGTAASWLQRLIDGGLLPDESTPAGIPMEDVIGAGLDASRDSSPSVDARER